MNFIIRRITLFLLILSSLLNLNAAAVEKWLIIGGGRGAGWELAHTIAAKKDHSCTIFARSKAKTDPKFAEFDKKPTVVEGDVTNDVASLAKQAEGASFIVIAQTFPYTVWEKSIQATVDNALAVAQKTGATLIYLARPYQYGNQRLITEKTIPQPNSHQGKVLNKIEMQIEDAASAGFVKSRIVCHSFPFGPNIGDGLLSKNFSGILKNKNRSWLQSKQKFEWIGGSGRIAMQLSYTPDLAKFIYEYARDKRVKSLNFNRINFAGHTVNSINRLGYLYAKEAGEEKNYELSLFSKMGLSAAAMFRPEATRAKDIYYSFENEILLDETIRRELFPKTERTSLKQAIHETFNWYQQSTWN